MPLTEEEVIDNVKNYKLYSSLLDFLNDIKNFAKTNTVDLEWEDEPYLLRLCIKDKISHKKWAIKITSLKDSFEEMRKNNESEKADLLARSFSYQEGKENLLLVLSGK